MARCLVTGGAGFIGSHLVDALVGAGHEVTVIDNLFTGRKENLEASFDRIRFVLGDIRDVETLKDCMEGQDFVFHLAAIPSVQRSLADPLGTASVNVMGTLNVLVCARDARVKRVIFASSSSVYGDTKTFPEVETLPVNPLSPYACSKASCEMFCRVFSSIYDMEVVSLRFFNVFGPRQDPHSEYSAVIPKFISALLQGRPPVVFGTGEQSRDFCYVENVVQANILAMEAKGVSGKTFNVACGETHSLLELLAHLQEITDCRVSPTFAPPRKGDVPRSHASIDAISKALNYKVFVSFREGLERTVAWYKSLLASH